MATFVGFGFGPIQSGLFLLEAFLSGNFSRYVVAEIEPRLVTAVRDNRGAYVVNVARKDRIDQVRVEGVELYNPREADDRRQIVAAIAQADELATALPSVNFYDAGGESSAAALLKEGLARRTTPAVLYAAENHNHAAEILTEKLAGRGTLIRPSVQALNTVIGKMSGVIADPQTIDRMRLATMTPATPRAILVEEFNRILISRIVLAGFRRGINVFIEKDNLLPFEEAKLYGHNAIHALIGYLADLRGLRTMADAAAHADLMAIARRAFIDEAGAALIQRHALLNDPLFTPHGFRHYAHDLLDRMVRPNLNDLVERVIRDPVRKLAYDDRLFGAMRLALDHGINPRNLAMGAAAAVLSILRHPENAASLTSPPPPRPQDLTESALRRLLPQIWANRQDHHADTLINLTWNAIGQCQTRLPA